MVLRDLIGRGALNWASIMPWGISFSNGRGQKLQPASTRFPRSPAFFFWPRPQHQREAPKEISVPMKKSYLSWSFIAILSNWRISIGILTRHLRKYEKMTRIAMLYYAKHKVVVYATKITISSVNARVWIPWCMLKKYRSIELRENETNEGPINNY